MMNEKDLLDLKQEINTAKTSKANLEGQKTSIMKQLRDSFSIHTIDQANKKLAQLETKLESITSEIKEGIEEIDKKYNLQNTDE